MMPQSKNKEKINHLIFDWTGVVNDAHDSAYFIVAEIFRRLNIPAISKEEFREKWIQPYMDFYHQYAPDLSLEEEKKMYLEIYPEANRRYPSKPYPGMVEILRELKNSGKDLIVISSDTPQHLLAEMKLFELEGIFHEIITDVHDKNHDLVKVIVRNGFKRGEAIFLGDTTHEIECGKKAQILTGAVTWGLNSRRRLEAEEPDFIFDSPAELKKLLLG